MNDLKYDCWGTARNLVENFPNLPVIELMRPDGSRVKVRVYGLTKKEKKQKVYKELLHIHHQAQHKSFVRL